MADAASSLFDMADAVESVGKRADEAGRRANRLRFSGEEISARSNAAEAFRLAGNDKFLQKAGSTTWHPPSRRSETRSGWLTALRVAVAVPVREQRGGALLPPP
ncbi:MAG: hypothetical protein VCF24_15825, partial [Candidatus Latescibacterota bacterium]